MKQRYIYWSLMFLILPLLVSCISSGLPDIVLKDDGQPCISIPANEDFFKSNKQFNVMATEIGQIGVGQLSLKYYHDPSKPYYVKTQECIDFDYHFQNNIPYSISFTSTEKGKNKPWVRFMRIKKNKDNTLQLLLDENARDAT
ncbi:putative T6SS immunity periplasmic lipoprotein [Snodgrassella alvi]|uniref:DUF7480 domain-containing protein n=1 Tax=Snodgrassella alvi TaxID=1196083 RepID=A0A2N9XUM6_9NEIS|nr:hypothetical protein [Snodgrassella alvi]PIT53068.1 hypothetical protein BHC49_12485 [Snodgrassella alvi]